MFRPLRILSALLLVIAPTSALVGEEVHYDSFVDAAVQVSELGVGGNVSALAPLLAGDASLIFADVRMTAFYDELVAFNWGMGIRVLTDRDWIVGGYGYFDRTHVDADRVFNQATLGMELLNVDWAFRINGYLPQSATEDVGPPRAVVRNRSLVVEHRRLGAYPGTDFEAGYLLRDWQEGAIELRGYLGGFFFNRSEGDFETLYGPRVRAEFRMYDVAWLRIQSRVVATGLYQWDRVRGSQGLVSLGLRWVFGSRDSPKLTRIRRRMVNPVGRLPGAVVEEGAWTEQATTVSGGVLRSFAVITANTPDPARVVADLGEQSIAVFSGAAGPIEVDRTIQLNSRQLIVGSPWELPVVGRQTGHEVTFHIGDPRPEVRALDHTRDVFLLPEQKGHIVGLDVFGGRNGIVGRGTTDYVLANNGLFDAVRSNEGMNTESTGNGILLDRPGREGDVAFNRVQRNHVGIKVLGEFDGELRNNRVAENISDGILVDGHLDGSLLRNETISNGGDGIRVRGRVDGSVTDNVASENGGSGIHIEQMVVFNVDGNTLTSNGSDGLRIDGQVVGRLNDNTATGNSLWGISVGEAGNGAFRNFSHDNGGGIELGLVLGNLEDNAAHRNGRQGIVAYGVTGRVTTNDVRENGRANLDGFDAGLHVVGRIGGEVKANIALNNRGEGILLELDSGEEVVVVGNVMDGNNSGLAEFVANVLPGQQQNSFVRLTSNTSNNSVPSDSANYQRLNAQIQLIDGGGNVGVIGD